MEPGELRVVSASPGADGVRLARAFAEAGIPFATGRGSPLASLPVVKLLRDALGAAGGLSRRSAERLGRSSYLSLGEPVERLASLLERSGAVDGRSSPAEALRRRASSLGAGGGRERAGLGRAAGRLDRLRALLAPFEEPGTARRHAARLAAFVDAAGIRRRAARAEPALAARDLAAISRVLDAAEEVARSLAHLGRGDAVLARGDWLAALDAALGSATLGSAAEPFGGAVELLGLDDAPGESARGALLVGCTRAGFPAPAPPEPLLRDPERQALCAHLRRQAVTPSSGRRAEGRHRALCAAAIGREAVLFAWRSEDGPVSPLVETGLLAAGVAVPQGPSTAEGPSEPRSAGDALRAAARWARSREAAAPPPPQELGERAGSALARGRIEAARRVAVDRREPSPFAGSASPGDVAAFLPAEWTPTQLEDYARCPFRLFLSMGVGLPRREASGVDIDLRDEGSLLHAALERFVGARVARGAWPPTGDEADRAEALAVADEVFAGFERAGRTGDPAVWGARRQAVRARLVRWVAAEARDADGCVPRLLEHRFGGDSGRPPLRFGEGEAAVAVQGRMDRVDADGRRLLVLDYKNSRASKDRKALLDPEAFGVTSFQIPVYLAAAARELPGREQLGATLALLRDAERLEPFTGAADELRAGPLGPQLERAIVGVVEQVRAGRFPIVSRDCERCDYGAVCRVQGVAELEEGAEGEG
jgi:RecB family exonuclease